jgi:hypothetical protein
MPDSVKKLIHAIELRIRIANRNNQSFVDLPYGMAADVVKLLKSQPEIVRCKDCKRGVQSDLEVFCTLGTRPYGGSCYHDLDWFCADGERR